MWWLAGNKTNILKSEFKGGYRFSKVGKQIRKQIPKKLLNNAEKKHLYKTLEKRKEGGITRHQMEGTIRELIDNKADNISRDEAIDLADHLEDMTGYENLRWEGKMAKKYSVSKRDKIKQAREERQRRKSDSLSFNSKEKDKSDPQTETQSQSDNASKYQGIRLKRGVQKKLSQAENDVDSDFPGGNNGKNRESDANDDFNKGIQRLKQYQERLRNKSEKNEGQGEISESKKE